jgi:hypothetical protein
VTGDILPEDDDKSFDQIDQEYNSTTGKENRRRQAEVRQIIREYKWTNKLQTLIDYGNDNILKTFHLRLKLEEVTK